MYIIHSLHSGKNTKYKNAAGLIIVLCDFKGHHNNCKNRHKTNNPFIMRSFGKLCFIYSTVPLSFLMYNFFKVLFFYEGTCYYQTEFIMRLCFK